MAESRKDFEIPSERPALNGGKRSPFTLFLAVVVSLGLHILLLALLLQLIKEAEIGSGGGTGWADQIEITASTESSSGLQGDPGDTAENIAQERRSLDVSIVYAPPPPPPPPEPEEYLPEEEEEPEPEEVVEEEVEPEPEPEIVEDALIEDEVDEEEISEELAPEGLLAPNAQEALVDTSAEGDGGGEGGLSDQLAGSPIGSDAQGLGDGVADSGRPGAYVPGSQLRSLLSGWTLRGTNGFSDGSTTYNNDRQRQEIPWRVYYAPNGQLQARFERYGSDVAHGQPRVQWFTESGTWTIEGDVLCQRISRWGSGGITCYEVHRDGDNIAMYYQRCRGVHRCYIGRLGPEGIMRSGRDLSN